MASRGCEGHRTGDGNWPAVLQRIAEQTSPVPVPATPHKHSRPALPGARQAVGPGPVHGAGHGAGHGAWAWGRAWGWAWGRLWGIGMGPGMVSVTV